MDCTGHGCQSERPALTSLLITQTDLDVLRRRVQALAEDRPAVYRMIGPGGRVMYVGKSKQLRTRLLSYFRASFPHDKAARIIQSAADVEWQYQPSDFAAHLEELRAIRRYRPVYNVQMNRSRRACFVKVSTGTAPRVYSGPNVASADTRHYGPFNSASRVAEAVRVLNDVLGLRDCALDMPIVFAEQGDLFGPTRSAACMRHELGRCTGPCGGLVTEAEYQRRIGIATDFLEARTAQPLDRVIAGMTAAADRNDFEQARRWRDRFEALEWLFAAVSRTRAAIDGMSFVYVQPGSHGDDRAYVISRARVRAQAPAPRTPIEQEAFRALVLSHADGETADGPLPVDDIDEIVLLLSWFRRHPAALRHTTPLDRWIDGAPVIH